MPVATPWRLGRPTLALRRPVVGVVLAVLGFSVNSHPAFRWLVVLTQPLLLVSDALYAAGLRVEIDCRVAATCLTANRGAYSLGDLRVLEARQYASLFLEAVVVLHAAFLMIMIGCCASRYPLRIFALGRTDSEGSVGAPPVASTYHPPPTHTHTHTHTASSASSSSRIPSALLDHARTRM
jgi:hypothetical protein